MELEIEERLQEIYKHLQIECKYIDLRKYKICVKIELSHIIYGIEILYIWDNKYTFDFNINNIINEIDNYIIEVFRR